MRMIVLSGFALLVMFCSSLPAATIHVDVGNVTGPEDGSEARPFNTIQEGIDNAGDGDTVLVADGVYAGYGNLNLTNDGKSLEIRSLNGPERTIIISLRGAGGIYLRKNDADADVSVVLEGLTFQGGRVECLGTSTIIRNCAIVAECIQCRGDASVQIVGCFFTGGVHGVSAFVDELRSVDIVDCVFQQCGTGISLGTATIANCLFVGCSDSAIEFSGGRATVVNCTITDCTALKGGAIKYNNTPNSSRPESELILRNTILWNNVAVQANQVFVGDSAAGLTIEFCDVQDGRNGFGGAQPTWQPTDVVYRNNISAIPLFANPDNGDYRLLPGSPCIDAGTAEGAPSTDIDGNPRPSGDFVDIGAYEYTYGDIMAISCASQPPDEMAIDETFQFALLASGQELPATIAQWDVSGGIGSISDTGLFTATDVGVGTVTATLKSNDAIAAQSTSISVVPTTYRYEFTQSLPTGVSIFSLPLQPEEPLLASTLASDLGATVVIRAVDGQFRIYIPEIEFGDFVLEGGQGVIVNLLTPADYAVQGYPWGTPIAAPIAAQTPTWAFAVAGRFTGTPTGSRLRVTNGRTHQQLLVPIDGPGHVASAFVDMSQHSVVSVGDEINVELIGPGNTPLGDARRYVISPEDISSAYLLFDMPLLPDQNQVLRNYPNPLNPETWIPYQLRHAGATGIDIYNLKGQLVRYLDLGYQQAGWYLSKERAAYWDGRDTVGEEVGSGIYFYRLRGHSSQGVQKLVVLR